MRCLITFGNISSQRPVSFSLALPSRSMTHKRIEILINFAFDPRNMLLSLHIGFSFVSAAVACAMLERTSGFEPKQLLQGT